MARPARVTIGNLATGLSLEPQYNPVTLKETIEANFAEVVVPGLSHPVLQYVATGAHQLALELGFDALAGASIPGGVDVDAQRRFLLSFMVSRRGARTVTSGAPPEMLFIWPGWMALRCKVAKLDIEHRLFSPEGPPTWFVASISLKEARDTRLYSEDVSANGTRRGGG